MRARKQDHHDSAGVRLRVKARGLPSLVLDPDARPFLRAERFR